jgi:uncharacterized protein (TIGR01777 family)
VRIAVTGASGFIGSALVPALRDAGHDVVTLVRRPPANDREVEWAPDAGTIDASRLRGVEGVVHLAGETLGQRWTTRSRERILRNRVAGMTLLATTMGDLDPPPSALVHASGIGYYGYDDPTVTEASPKGAGFAAEVAEALERAADPARAKGIRVVSLRQAPVLARHGGALRRMLTPFRLGLGGRLGSGRQSWSWVSLRDVVRVYRFVLESDVSGPVNVAAGTATNADFTKALGRALRRPTLFPVPGFALRLAFGGMADEMLLGGQRMESRRLTDAGFAFEDTDLQAYLDAALRD